MVEPSEFTEVYTTTNDVISHSFANVEGICKHAFHIHRYHPEKVKVLNKYLEILTTQKDNIYSNLEAIQSAFDTIDNSIVLYLHNMEKVKTELDKLAALQNNELEQSKKLYNDDEQLKSIIETGNKEFIEEMNRITDYIEKF